MPASTTPPRQIWPALRGTPASLLMPSRNAGSRRPSTVTCAVTPSRPRRPAPLMGCAASSDRAQRRGRARGHSEASTAGLLLVGPADEEAAPEPAMPGSPSFRYYCQKAAAVDALVAEADAADGEGSVRIMETCPQARETSDLTVEDASKIKIVEVAKWHRFRGLAVVAAALYNLFSRHKSKPSTPTSPPAAKSLPPGPAPAARSHT